MLTKKTIWYGISVLCLTQPIASQQPMIPKFESLETETKPPGCLSFSTPQKADMSDTVLHNIDLVVQDALDRGCMPGAVVLVANRGFIVYHKAFGFRTIEPTKTPITPNTVFDVASLTKPIVTATLTMMLVEKGKIKLSDPVATYMPEFAANGKEAITIEHILTHRSGLAPEPNIKNLTVTSEFEKKAALKILSEQKLEYPTNTKFVYSCSGYIILGALIERLTGEPLDVLAQKYIFGPLGMTHTGFCPKNKSLGPIAPCDKRDDSFICGDVHDPAAFILGGVAGNAGLFSTAVDLAIFCQMLINKGQYADTRILSPLSVLRMTSAGSTPEHEKRGLGWDIDTIQSFPRGDLFPTDSYGHTGFTGVSIWLNPKTETFIIFLSNRLHPDGKGNVKDVRARIATIVAASLMCE